MLRKDMGKKRVKQLKSANEEEDKSIHRLEKLLKIDKSKSKKGIPRMFNDGLDYALEMCLPENIEKMYAAAKEAADADKESDSEWQEDFAMATGEIESNAIEENSKNTVKSKAKPKDDVKIAEKRAAEKEKSKRLREIESKYFGDSDDELASDLSDVDSEFERSENEENGNDDDGSESSDDAPEEVHTISKSSKKRKLEKTNAKLAAKENHDSGKDENSEEDESSEDGEEHDDSDESDLDGDGLSDFDDLDMDEEPKGKVRKTSNKNPDENSSGDSDEDSNIEDDFGDENDSDGSGEADEKPDIWEDIYGRKRDKDGNIIKEISNDTQSTGKYIPPHLRARLAEGNAEDDSGMDPKRKEKLMQLKRLLKGQLNRLSEANMHKITTEIDNLYMKNSRHDMNSTLSALICDALISRALAPERMVMEHSLLIAALHANVGIEVAANLLENLVDRFNQMMKNGIEQYDVEDKTLDNIIFILCHMYTFKVNSVLQLKILLFKLIFSYHKLLFKYCRFFIIA